VGATILEDDKVDTQPPPCTAAVASQATAVELPPPPTNADPAIPSGETSHMPALCVHECCQLQLVHPAVPSGSPVSHPVSSLFLQL
jgi:hypothetical protein